MVFLTSACVTHLDLLREAFIPSHASVFLLPNVCPYVGLMKDLCLLGAVVGRYSSSERKIAPPKKGILSASLSKRRKKKSIYSM